MYVILGVKFGHEASAAIVVDGQVVADVCEERFTRVKHSSDDPIESIAYCLKAANITINQVDEIALGGIAQASGFETMFGHRLGKEDPVWHGGRRLALWQRILEKQRPCGK